MPRRSGEAGSRSPGHALFAECPNNYSPSNLSRNTRFEHRSGAASNQQAIPAPSRLPRQLNAFTQQALHFIFIGSGMLVTNPLARYVTCQLMETQGDVETLLTRHLAIALDLQCKRGFRRHDTSVDVWLVPVKRQEPTPFSERR